MRNPYDKKAIKELKDMTGYELWIVNFFRSKFHGQMDKSRGITILTAGDYTESGKLKPILNYEGTISFSEKAVRKSLQKFIPLAFVSSFKLQDMVIEWILKINGINKWRFTEKIKEYNRLLKNPSAYFPPCLSREPILNEAFFSLFKELSGYRNILTHGSSFLLHNDGSLEMTNKAGNTLLLKPHDQAAYHRLCCSVLDVLLNPGKDLLLNFAVIKSDFAKLDSIHKVKGFVKSNVRHGSVRFIVPVEYKKSEMPYACEVNMDELWETMREWCPAGKNGQLILSLEIEGYTKETVYNWSIPPSHVPLGGTLQLAEGDPRYDRFLIKIKAHEGKKGRRFY